jgi:adenine-specific DNA-methyltransferase
MPTLNWIGKDKVINHHKDVPFKILEPQYTFKNGQESPTGSSDNKIIHGDNLEALKALLPEYEGRVNCIYIDPPYNTGNEGWAYNDNVNHPKIKKWLGEVVGKEGEDLSRHDKWLCMMYPRLKLLHKLLADDGVMFISIDDIELESLKFLANEIFGKSNFIATLIWRTDGNFDNQAKVKVCHEYILMYAKKFDKLGLPDALDPNIPV